MKLTVFKYLQIAGMLFLLAGCRVAVVVPEGGYVAMLSAPDCLEGGLCIVEATDTSFSESFTAVPNPGWAFLRWNTAEGYTCSSEQTPTCTLSASFGVGVQAVEAFVQSDKIFYIMPVFSRTLSIPASELVEVDGREWIQPKFFGNVSWSAASAACPAGVCAGSLKGYDVAGWTWATITDTNALINFYHGATVIGPGPDVYVDPAETFFTDIIADGWKLTNVGGSNITGSTRELFSPTRGYYTRFRPERYQTNQIVPISQQSSVHGIWLYRDI